MRRTLPPIIPMSETPRERLYDGKHLDSAMTMCGPAREQSSTGAIPDSRYSPDPLPELAIPLVQVHLHQLHWPPAWAAG